MKDCDSYAINILKLPSLTLMENAAKAALEEFLNVYRGGGVAVICGGGNNGGDGAAFARLLREKGVKSDVYLFCVNMSDDLSVNFQRLKQTDVNIYLNPAEYDFKGYAYIVDALFGTGLNRGLEGEYKKVVGKINQSGAFVISVDMPSGLFGGVKDFSAAVKADLTVSLAAYKYCQLFEGIDLCGNIIVKDIGIPIQCGSDVYQNQDVKKFFPPRKKDTHKGSYGKLCIIAGSGKYFGAAAISYGAAASLISGCGYVCLCVPKFLADSYRCHIAESVFEYLPDDGENALFDANVLDNITDRYDAVCIGMGMGQNKNTFDIAAYLLKNYNKKLLLDADALNSIAVYDKDIFKRGFNCRVIITPHIAEFSRLTGASAEQIKSDSLKAAEGYSGENNVTVLLKGHSSVICGEGKSAVNVTGTAAMAKAGSGDVLSGIIGGLLARGFNTFESGAAGAFLHGRAGEIAQEKLGEHSVLPRDITRNLAEAIKNL